MSDLFNNERLVIVDCESLRNYEFIKKIKKEDLVILVGDKDTEVNASAMISLMSIGCKVDYREMTISSRLRSQYIMFLVGQLSTMSSELVLVTEDSCISDICKSLLPNIVLLSGSTTTFGNSCKIMCDEMEGGLDDIEEVDVPNLQKWKGTLATQYEEMVE